MNSLEDDIITKVALEQELAKLTPMDQDIAILIGQLERPTDWLGSWPPEFEDMAVYIGMKYYGKPISEATIRYRFKQMKEIWAGNRGPFRKWRRGSP